MTGLWQVTGAEIGPPASLLSLAKARSSMSSSNVPLYNVRKVLLGYRGVVFALITVFGYMLTDMGPYGLFKVPKYRTNSERILFAATLVTVLGLIVKRCFF